jgi:hypothetical protein
MTLIDWATPLNALRLFVEGFCRAAALGATLHLCSAIIEASSRWNERIAGTLQRGCPYFLCDGAKVAVATRAELFQKIKPLETNSCPFANLPEKKSGRWGAGLTPQLSCHSPIAVVAPVLQCRPLDRRPHLHALFPRYLLLQRPVETGTADPCPTDACARHTVM